MSGEEEHVEWGYLRTKDGVVLTPYVNSESACRRILRAQEPGKYLLVRRTVGPWIEVQP